MQIAWGGTIPLFMCDFKSAANSVAAFAPKLSFTPADMRMTGSSKSTFFAARKNNVQRNGSYL